MREIKFRAWGRYPVNLIKDEMIYEWQESSYLEYIGFDGGGFFEIMQYTGLKDKNGKEIYEGDIVRAPYHDNPVLIRFGIGSEGEPADTLGSYIGWCLGTEEEAEYNATGFTQYETDKIEVIGNIYENPELLEEMK